MPLLQSRTMDCRARTSPWPTAHLLRAYTATCFPVSVRGMLGISCGMLRLARESRRSTT
jgi:hypothetical protein